jgi:hypothetical protein
MLKRLRTALVTSFVGAIALGWLFAQGILHFASIFSVPIASWLRRREYSGVMGHTRVTTNFYLQDALPELVRSLVLLALGYLLLRWLYFKPLEEQTTQPEKGAQP